MLENNILLETHLKTADVMLKSFYANCELAAVKNDFKIDDNEKVILKKIYKANEAYIKEINKILKKYFS